MGGICLFLFVGLAEANSYQSIALSHDISQFNLKYIYPTSAYKDSLNDISSFKIVKKNYNACTQVQAVPRWGLRLKKKNSK
jgi:hypothetical protein